MDAFKIGQLNISSNAVTTFEQWTKFKRAVSYFMDSKAIKDSIQKKAILLHKGGPELQEIYASLEKANEVDALAAKDQYAFALNLLDKHFRPTVNRSYERYMFRSMRQGDESIEQYIVRLRHQADNCSFADTEQEIVDQVIFGIANAEYRKKILEKRLESLDQVVELSKLLESVETQSKQMSNSSATSSQSQPPLPADSVARIIPSREHAKNDGPPRPKQCEFCARRHPPHAECPARDATCYKCEKKGHFANASRCPDRRRKPGDGAASSRSSQLSVQSPLSRSAASKREEVKLVRASDAVSSSDESDDDYSFAVSDRSDRLPPQLRENRVTLIAGGVQLEMSVDSGSSKEIIDAETWKQLRCQGIRFRSAEVTRHLFPYGKARPLEVSRAVYVEFSSSSASAWSKVYVLGESEGRCEAILGSKLAKKLNVLRVGDEVVASIGLSGASADQAEDDELRQSVTKLVEANRHRTGKLHNFKLDLPLDSSVLPVAQGCRRFPFALRKPLKDRTDGLIRDDIIERVVGATNWVSNIVPVIKKNGDLRLCVDMRRANQAVLRERYPIPTFDEIVADLHGSEFFSKIDLEAAYHQVELSPQSRPITTFVTPDGLFQFKRLFFGVRCAPEIFQRIMQDLLRDMNHVRVFFDDIIIFSKSQSEHRIHVQQVVQRLIENGLAINLEKSKFGVKQIDFLGHKISKNVVKPNDANLAAIRDFSEPTSKKDLQSFIGLINFVSRFIPHYSTVTAPLRVLLKKNSVFRWSDEQRKAFQTLKDSAATMKAAMFDPSARICLLTDASPVGLGAVLLQYKEKSESPEIVAFASHSLTPAERNYAQIEREALAIVWGCEKFRMYLLGRTFDLLTDHKPLELIFGPKSRPNARLERWLVRLQCFDYNIRHIAGEANIADPFSRLLQDHPGRKACFNDVHHAVCRVSAVAVPKKFHLNEIQDHTRADEELQRVMAALKTEDALPPDYVRIRYELTECDGLLLRGDRIVPPTTLRDRILHQAHEGHPGAEAMKRRLRTKVWWPKMDRQVDKFVKHCLSCTIVSSVDPPPPLRRTTLPDRAWEYVAIDHMGPLPSGEHILVVVDYFSRFMEFAFTKSTSAAETIRLLWHIFARHGFPSRLKSDNGPAFRSDEFAQFLDDYGVTHITSPPLWPQANGEVERQNRSLLKRLKIAASEKQNLEIAACKFALMYNSTAHSVTGIAPAQLLFRRAIQDKLPSIAHPSVLREDFADRDADSKFAGKLAADTRRRASPSAIQPGDSVLLQAPQTNKLSPSFESEPFTVLESTASEVTLQRGDKTFRRSIAAVKPIPEAASPAEFSHKPSYADSVKSPASPSAPFAGLSPRHSLATTDVTFRGWPDSASSPVTTQLGLHNCASPQNTADVVYTRYGRASKPPKKLDL